MRVLVTGGAGYLGTWVTALLLEKGHQVRIFDRFCFGEESIQEFVGNADFESVRGDIRDLGSFPELLDGVEAVVHLAGLANDPSCDLDPEMTTDVNVDASMALIELARVAGDLGIEFAPSAFDRGFGYCFTRTLR